MATVDEHTKELLKLPVEDRAHAAKLLLDSLTLRRAYRPLIGEQHPVV